MGRSLPWYYPLIMLASVAVAVVLSRRTQSSLGLSRRERLGVGLGAFCGAMIGAKLPFLLADWDSLQSGRAWFENGKTIVFGLVGGYFGVEVAKAFLGVRVKTGDTFAVPVAAALAIGRLGCFAAGCCHGTVTTLPWAVDFGDGLKRHPTQLYESAFHLSAALILAWLSIAPREPRRRLGEGEAPSEPASALGSHGGEASSEPASALGSHGGEASSEPASALGSHGGSPSRNFSDEHARSMIRRGALRGQLIKLYIIAYLTYRFLTEFIRPEPVLALGLTGYQWACLGLIPVFIALWMRDARTALLKGASEGLRHNG